MGASRSDRRRSCQLERPFRIAPSNRRMLHERLMPWKIVLTTRRKPRLMTKGGLGWEGFEDGAVVRRRGEAPADSSDQPGGSGEDSWPRHPRKRQRKRQRA